jgi:uncharacterized lipoprotein YajG
MIKVAVILVSMMFLGACAHKHSCGDATAKAACASTHKDASGNEIKCADCKK